MFLASMAFMTILAVALISAFARPASLHCHNSPFYATNVSQGTAAAQNDGDSSNYPYNNLRLPLCVKPVSYQLHLTTDMTRLSYTGTVIINIVVEEADTNYIVLHSNETTITAAGLTHSTSGKKVAITETVEIHQNEQYYLGLAENLVKGENYILTFSFHAKISREMAGFYVSSYKLGQDKQYLAVTQMEPSSARKVFPCFDEPNLKATFQLNMSRPSDYTSVFNSDLQETVSDPDHQGYKVDIYKPTPLMSTYLVAFMVSKFTFVTGTFPSKEKDIEVRSHANPSLTNLTQLSLDCHGKVLPYYEEFFGIPFPLSKLDVVAVPDFEAGAMENWGMITYREVAVLGNERTAPSSLIQNAVLTMAHELAHQWFGNLVTMQWWSDLWLNEGFASYVEYLGGDRYRPAWELRDQFITMTTHRALYDDSVSTSHPIQQEIRDPATVHAMFDEISYGKGAAVILMLEGFLGMEKLKMGLKNYLLKYKYQNAKTEDLWREMADVATGVPVDVADVMSLWTKQMGYPLVRAQATWQSDGTFTSMQLHQSHFVLDDNMKIEGSVWPIPVSYLTDTGETDTFWLTAITDTFTLKAPSKWVKLNVNETGFYRVQYDDRHYQVFTQLLQTNHEALSATDRANLINDVFTLAQANRVNIATALDLCDYIDRERRYTPWVAALAKLNALELITRTTTSNDVHEQMKAYIRGKLQGIVSDLGWEDTGEHLDRMLRPQLLAAMINVGDENIIEKGKKKFEEWQKNPEVDPPGNLQVVIFHAGVKAAGGDNWRFLWQQFRAAVVPSKKSSFLAALPLTQDMGNIRTLLDGCLNKDVIRSQDLEKVVCGLAANPVGSLEAWAFLQKHYREFLNRYLPESFTMRKLQSCTADVFSSMEQYNAHRDFYVTMYPDGLPKSIQKDLEYIKSRADFMSKSAAALQDWLSKHAS